MTKRLREGGEPQQVEVAVTIRDHRERPCIPGSTLKGRLENLCDNNSDRDRLFGYSTEGKESNKRFMGRLLVQTAARRTLPDLANRPYPDPDRGTFVDSRTTIDPETGTADVGEETGGQLFHVEMVAPGATFAFELTMLDPRDGDVGALQDVLSALAQGTCIGRGRKLRQGRIRLLPEGLSATRITLSATGEWHKKLEELQLIEREHTPPTIFDEVLELRCDGPYLTSDGSHEPVEGEPQIVALLDSHGQPILNGSSIMGALRARCRWLARLDDEDISDDPKRVLRWLEAPECLSPVERLFGVAGWGSCIEIEQLTRLPGCEDIELTSVATDRFTGGPIDTALYTSRAYLNVAFQVRLALRDRPGLTQEDRRLFGALVGDISRNGIMLGHGAAKGFGWFRARQFERPEAAHILAQLHDVPQPDWSDDDLDTVYDFKERTSKAPYIFIPLNSQVVRADTPPQRL